MEEESKQPEIEVRQDPQTSFIAEFSDGYGFGRMMEFIRGICNNAHLVFSKDFITCTEGTDKVMVHTKIDVTELTNYEYISKSEKYIVGICVTSLKKMIKDTTKKNSITIYRKAGERCLCITTDIGKNTGTIPLMEISRYTKYSIPKFSHKIKPNCIVKPYDFTQMCSQITALKPATIEIVAYSKGIKVYADKTADSTGRVSKLGSFPKIVKTEGMDNDKVVKPRNKVAIEIVNNPTNTYKISCTFLKALSKLGNLCKPKNIKIYSVNNSPLMISTGFSFGQIEVYIGQEKKKKKEN